MRKNDETKEPKRDQAWFERTVAELKAELEKRQEELLRELEEQD
jgi:hypothetical protein